MDQFTSGGRRYRIEQAGAEDLPAIISLLADDPLGVTRESADLSRYQRAFDEITSDPHQHLACVKDDGGGVVGTMQLSLIPGLSRGGSLRLQIEGVRVAEQARGGGLGRAMLMWAHEYGRRRGAVIAQLTSDRTRTQAHQFYTDLGYEPTHVGFKRAL